MILILEKNSLSWFIPIVLKRPFLSKFLHLTIFREVTKQYIKTGVFTEFQRGSIETVIKKSKHFKQRNFMRGVIPASDDKDS